MGEVGKDQLPHNDLTDDNDKDEDDDKDEEKEEIMKRCGQRMMQVSFVVRAFSSYPSLPSLLFLLPSCISPSTPHLPGTTHLASLSQQNRSEDVHLVEPQVTGLN